MIGDMASYGTDWLYLLVPLALLIVTGPWLARRTGLPRYAGAGVVSGYGALIIAVLGFVWDVTWHVDLGRDEVIFTPAHTAILLGLFGIVVSAAIIVIVATVDDADVALKWRSYRAPWAAVPLAACGLGAITGFPLDEFWHRAYGIDVSMWGPTHLVMIGGASLAPLALALLIHEGGGGSAAFRRYAFPRFVAAITLGLSTFQLEFDLGVAQWQQLYHPVLIALATGAGLTLARHLLGPGGALIAALGFILQRALIAFVVGGPLHQTTPRFPLYLAAAIAIEIAALASARRSATVQGVAAGLAAGTVGLAGEWAWTYVWGRTPWGAGLLPEVLLAVAVAVAAALLGTAGGRILSGRAGGIPAGVLAGAGLVLLAGLAIPNPRNATGTDITIETTSRGVDRVAVSVTLADPSVIDDPDWFEVFAWQGGHSEAATLHRVDVDTWATRADVPVGGNWKTIVRLAQGSTLAGAPVFMPLDEEIEAAEIPVVPTRTVAFERDTELLMREAHEGDALPAILAYIAIGTIAVVWITSLVLAYRGVSRRRRLALAGRRVVVTGAAGGIGGAVVSSLRADGAIVVGLDLAGSDVDVDVCDAGSVSTAVAEAESRLGGIDVLVHLAGIGRAHDAGGPPDAAARRIVDVNFWGTWQVTAAAMPALRESGGHVVVTASGLAIANAPWAAAYSASKRAVSAWADALRIEYAGVDVTVVNPGYVRTPIHDESKAQGVSLEGVVPADDMDDVVEAYRQALRTRPRAIATSAQTTMALAIARHLPATADRFTARQVRRLGRPAPTFVGSQPSAPVLEDTTTR
ncbi:MAG TPA: SDR family NAD(P)-dependent oxidoreductase [Mycobacteriales bacterium]|nr:SDR family NAD(P)-dependent oxidoreductase [Mycobacteriales bacterium]